MARTPGAVRSPRGLGLTAAPLLVLLSLSTACSGSGEQPASTTVPSQPGTTASSATPGSSPGSSDDVESEEPESPSASTSVAEAPDPTAAATIAPVRRHEGRKTRVPAKAGTFHSAVRWSDGLQLAVVAVEHDTTGGRGAGSHPGRPETTFRFRLDNASSATVDARSVVVTTTYATGKVHRVAQPVYDARSQDFGTRLETDAEATATYSFSIPKRRLGSVNVTVDLDARHDPARFTGSAR